jgi:CRP-like cAMP-binding protein
MINKLINKLKEDNTNWQHVKEMFREQTIASKTILLQEGEIAQNLSFIKKGCLRMWFNNDGKDITLQFFFEGQAVASIDSFMKSEPSQFSLETIEPSIVVSIQKEDFNTLFQLYPELKDGFQEIALSRMRNYAQLFLSRIKDTPRQRYLDLIKNHREIIQRIPQHYIASYLGITSISLSRIRNRK